MGEQDVGWVLGALGSGLVVFAVFVTVIWLVRRALDRRAARTQHLNEEK